MKVILLGSTGLLGKALVRSLKAENSFQLITPAHQDLDLLHFKAVQAFIMKHSPDWIIDTAAYTQVDKAEIEPEDCFKVNVSALENILSLGYPLIHFSTDYVFGDVSPKDFPEGLPEDFQRDALNYYGKTKVMAESLLEHYQSKWINIRTSSLFGDNDSNFVEKILQKSEALQPISVIKDQIMRPTFNQDLAQAVVENFLKSSRSSGHYHLQNSGAGVSWADFAREILKPFSREDLIRDISHIEYTQKAQRPPYSVLQNTKLPPLRPWKEALIDYLKTR